MDTAGSSSSRVVRRRSRQHSQLRHPTPATTRATRRQQPNPNRLPPATPTSIAQLPARHRVRQRTARTHKTHLQLAASKNSPRRQHIQATLSRPSTREPQPAPVKATSLLAQRLKATEPQRIRLIAPRIRPPPTKRQRRLISQLQPVHKPPPPPPTPRRKASSTVMLASMLEQAARRHSTIGRETNNCWDVLIQNNLSWVFQSGK